jgi:hypothetical protein
LPEYDSPVRRDEHTDGLIDELFEGFGRKDNLR